MKIYAGVGSRETPAEYLHLCQTLAGALRDDGWTLRSGHAEGADQAFEAGAKDSAQVFLPWPGYERDTRVTARLVRLQASPAAHDVAAAYHPAWERLSKGAKSLHARNSHIVLGEDLLSPVTFLVCWTPKGADAGGTAQAIRIARQGGIPVYNLALPDDVKRVSERIEGPG